MVKDPFHRRKNCEDHRGETGSSAALPNGTAMCSATKGTEGHTLGASGLSYHGAEDGGMSSGRDSECPDTGVGGR